MSFSMSHGQQRPTVESGYVIPTKCRMVFHMRDEVCKDKGVPNQAEDDRTGLNIERSHKPQQQPRHPRQYRDQPTFPLKKSSSAKRTKTVSFREPEPWRDCPSKEVPAATIARPIAEDLSDSPPVFPSEPIDVPRPATKLTTGLPSSALSTSLPDFGSSAPTITYTRPSSYSPPRASTAPSQSQRHRRNTSAPLPANFTCATNSTTRTSSPPSSKNRISRLWKSIAQKCSQSQNHHHHGIHIPVVEAPGVLVRQGSDLEPLVHLKAT